MPCKAQKCSVDSWPASSILKLEINHSPKIKTTVCKHCKFFTSDPLSHISKTTIYSFKRQVSWVITFKFTCGETVLAGLRRGELTVAHCVTSAKIASNEPLEVDHSDSFNMNQIWLDTVSQSTSSLCSQLPLTCKRDSHGKVSCRLHLLG